MHVTMREMNTNLLTSAMMLLILTLMCMDGPSLFDSTRQPRAPARALFDEDPESDWSMSWENSHYWRHYMRTERVRDTESLAHEKFRQCFRVPYSMFETFVDAAKSSSKLGRKPGQVGRPQLPIELKSMGALRHLAIGCPFDELFASTEISGMSHFKFYPQFLAWMMETYYDKVVYAPRNAQEIQASANLYNQVGIPGAVSSMDGVHLPWHRAPTMHRFNYTGTTLYHACLWVQCVRKFSSCI
jgi:hypothetical protein